MFLILLGDVGLFLKVFQCLCSNIAAMFLILLGDVGLLPTENFCCFTESLLILSVLADTILTFDSENFLGPKILARSFTFTLSSIWPPTMFTLFSVTTSTGLALDIFLLFNSFDSKTLP